MSHLVARTRADVYAWIAYDSNHLDAPSFTEEVIRDAREARDQLERRVNDLLEGDEPGDPVADDADGERNESRRRMYAEAETKMFATFDERTDVARAFAWTQAEAICRGEEQPDFGVNFAHAECLYALLDAEGSPGARDENELKVRRERIAAIVGRYEALVVAIAARRREHRELRRIAELDAASVICHARLVALRPVQDRRTDAQEALSILRHVHDATDDMHTGVTVLSSLQRRNLAQAEFVAEIEALAHQAHLDTVGSA
jgi:hypothetical protein